MDDYYIRRFRELSGGYDLEYASDGRLINAILNPYNSFFSITEEERKIYAEMIKSRADNNLSISYNFSTILLS